MLGIAVGQKVEDVRAEINELTALLVETQAELLLSPSWIDLRCKATVLDAEIEYRWALLAVLLNTGGVA